MKDKQVDPAELFEVRCEECKGEGKSYRYSDGKTPAWDNCPPCGSTGWRPMTADEVEEMQKTCWTKTLDHTVTLMVRDGYTLDYHGKPVRLRENS